MNLPNKITVFRVILIPFFLIFIARKYNLVTDFGKFMDPLADKLLVTSAMIALIPVDRIMAWVVIIIIAREFIISGFRLVAADNGKVIAAGWWGKVKTAVTMVMICVLIANLGEDIASAAESIRVFELILIYVSAALTVISLIDYLVKNKDVITTFK